MQKEGWVLCDEGGSAAPVQDVEKREAPLLQDFFLSGEIQKFLHSDMQLLENDSFELSQWELKSGLWTIFIKIAWECFIQIQIPGSYSRPAESDLWGLGDRKQHWAIFMNSFQLKKYLRICPLPDDLNILTNENIVYFSLQY